MNKFDIIIIGGGATAFATAIRANELGAKSVMINSGLPIGGTCVNVGCVPSKILAHAGEIVNMVRNNNVPGLELGVESVDFKRIINGELRTVDKFREEKYEKVLSDLKNTTLVEGKAEFYDKNKVKVKDKVFESDYIVVASGSSATIPPIKNLREIGYMTHIEAMRTDKIPKRLTVIGAGPVGLELAQIYSRFGSKVTILQRNDRIFPRGEVELTGRLSGILEDEKITIETGVNINGARLSGKEKILSYIIDGVSFEIASDEILLSSGKTPNTADLHLDIPGVKTSDNRAIIVNEYLQTNISNIFAGGDVADLPRRLETTAGREGTIMAENILNGAKLSIDYDTVPYAVFTDPQYASVGLTEEEQMARMGTCDCRTMSFESLPKAGIIGREEGMIKMNINPKTKEIVGVHILSPNAGDIIAQAMILIKNKNTIYDIIESEPVFPTLSEAVKYVALSFVKDISKMSCCV